MSLKSKSSTVTILIHVLTWLVLGFVLFGYQPLTMNVELPYQFWIKQTLIFSMLVGAFYLNSEAFVPRYLLKNRTGMYFLCVIILIGAIYFLDALFERSLDLHRLMDAAFHKHGPPKHGEKNHFYDFALLFIMALVLGISTSITSIQKWQGDARVREALEQDKISSELSFLKAQINPHFFFNTLNNIYALTHINADTSRKAIHQLSRMMRYVLYDTQHGTALLSQEIAFIKDYISLMQLRLTDKVTVTFDTPETVSDMTVAPMIFLPFVENAFKHGISATLPSNILISVQQQAENLELRVENSIYKDSNPNLEENKGIGLTNTLRRLDLLYAGKYTLDIKEDADTNTYKVHLTLNLS
ncbi:sensor histidine kinase [Mucilaginibacter flavus]|uniref:sensor histidine kinase n=1 Tax=Mucilaginibacter flavus TaxID=931504 RepID=UPI0025B2A839|nr:histidine kinase [Mucilaginibacter flavus]MDN3579956.1 histidine kinase [Mucilaginibacter flavus]